MYVGYITKLLLTERKPVCVVYMVSLQQPGAITFLLV